ncbi:MAG: SDR family NAD(P)-dependent oxidoreductase [Deltaproteobacteria bacterium]|jgi:UDP-glucose 4-epimerase|nr:SDR family NAD(P)-dependent oxidoreductase [Deltaproteobacteria bacterium]
MSNPSAASADYGSPLIVVTGGAGFIGSHLVEALVKERFRVRVLDDLSSGKLSNLSQVEKSMEFHQADVRDQKQVENIIAGAKVVYHLAGMSSVPQSLNDPKLCLEINGQGTLNVFEASAKGGVERLVYASSSAVYGDLPSPHVETMTPQPNTPYAAIKLLGEHLGLFYSRSFNVKTICLRYFNVYGPRQSPDGADAGVIPIFVKALSEGRPAVVFGSGRQTRDFIHVRDVVRATMSAGSVIEPSDGVFNVAAGQAISINELLQLMKRIFPDALEPLHAPAREGDPIDSAAIIDEAKNILGFEASISLAEGLAELFS